MVYLSVAINFILKMITFKKGSLLLFSSLVSFTVTFVLSVLTTTDNVKVVNDSIFQTLIKGVEIRDIILTLTIEAFFFLCFIVFTTTDLITGIQNAIYFNSLKKEPLPLTEVIESHKLWRTFWKSFGVSVLTLMMTGLAIFLLLVNSYTPYWVILWSLICFWVMGCGFEFYSIGENLAKRNDGNKPPIFGFVDKILEALQKKAISKIDSSFNILEDNSNSKKDEKTDN